MKAELYTATKLTTIRVTALLFLLSVILGSSIHWMLPTLIETQGPTGLPEQTLPLYDPNFNQFQLQTLDISGSGQTSALIFAQLVVLILGVLIPATSFRHGTITWKAITGRSRWGLNIIATVAIVSLVITTFSCLLTLLVAAIAINMHDVDWNVDGLPGIWFRGIIALTLLALTATGITLATKSGAITATIIGIVVGAETIITALSSFTNWDPKTTGWLPMHAISSAVQSSFTAPYSIPVGFAICAGWTALTLGIGLTRLKTYNL